MLFSTLFTKVANTLSALTSTGSPQSTPSTLKTYLLLQEQSGQPSGQSKQELSFIQFMGTLQGLILAKANQELEEATSRRLSAQQMASPHSMFIPRLTHDGLEWVCKWGSEDALVVGRGSCPAEALINFDLAWFGQPPTKV